MEVTWNAKNGRCDAELIMLGTGSAFPKYSYNTCFAVKSGDGLLLVDAGGGNGILKALEKAGIDAGEIHNLFITHSHTDHILGAVWVIRSIINRAKANAYEGKLNLYGNSDVLSAVDTICRITLLPSHYNIYKSLLNPVNVEENITAYICGAHTEFFDVGSENVLQSGFRMILPGGKTLVCLGDESLTEKNSSYADACDYLVCGAFCRYADKDIYKPYEKHHHTVRDVAVLAEQCDVRNLILVHCEDNNLASRCGLYSAEALEYYSGKLIVPVDNQVICLK